MKLSEIITQLNTKYGAPMGRHNIGTHPITVTSGPNFRIYKANQTKVYEKRIPLSEGYDMGGAYWGIGPELRVMFTKDLSYIKYYRIK